MQVMARLDFCRFLSACYYEPGPLFAEERLFESIVRAAAELEPSLAARARRLREEFESESLETLLIDHTRLFLGPDGALAQPYGAAWLSGEKTLMQDSTVAIAELYEQGGFEISEDFRDLPDHIAAELEFLYLLLFREAAGQDPHRAAELRSRLLHEHLGRWIPPFAAAVRQAAQSGFYRELAMLTGQFIASEMQRDGSQASGARAAPCAAGLHS